MIASKSSGVLRLPFAGGFVLSLLGAAFFQTGEAAAQTCARTVTANVVAFDQPLMFNRLGAQNINGMMYALRADVIDKTTGRTERAGGTLTVGNVELRPDKRARPIVLRVAAGDCLTVNFENLLTPVSNPFNAPVPELQIDDQVADRFVGFHPQGLELVGDIGSDASFVGNNANSLVPPGGTATYRFFAPEEGTFLALSYGATIGSEGTGGNTSSGLFGQVNVEPIRANFYRSQVSEEELRLSTIGTAPTGHPIVDYEALYPMTEPWISEGKAGLPILNMLTAANELVHSDINAIVMGSQPDGSFAPDTYPLESVGLRNPTVPNRLEAFREFATIFHDEVVAAQAFPAWFNDPVLTHTLHGVRDGFMINYGSGGIGSEIIANRLRVGPMHDCLDCAFEEFFLNAFTVGDPGMLVDVPANTGLEACTPALQNCAAVGPKATMAFYPDDPSNVHHSYTGDFVKFRNVHAGPKEQHVFHLHNHQWLFNPNDDNSNYIDAQGIGPGSGYTYEINFGGSGNRNKTAGDAIFHCHFYPHFAQGMWELWRNHDTFESGTKLAVSGGGFHTEPFALADGTPAAGARALPDGEILAGTPIVALVPLPGKAMAPLPGRVEVVTKDADGNGIPESSQAKVIDRNMNPGYPFWIAGIETTVGQRPSTPPLDMITQAEAAAAGLNPVNAGGTNGGLPRHTLDGYAAGGASIDTQNRLDFSKVIVAAKPVYFPETGTDVEQATMAFHAQRAHPSVKQLPNGTFVPADFITNGAPRVPGAPYHEPCIDDEGDLFLAGQQGEFFSAQPDQLGFVGSPVFGADNPRIYRAAVVQTDVVFNKVGYHYPQQRIIVLDEDVAPTLDKTRPPEPFVIRMNTFDCTQYFHTNLVPEVYELDDYQVRTPTDIVGQHIHLPKWDLTAADGSGNGWNYEDGTLSPGAVRERIEAINLFNTTPGNTPVPTLEGVLELHPEPHPFFGAGPNGTWLGARTTIQRWFADPVVNTENIDRGLGIIFTHDHFGPSTHQQIGLYATVLTEPARSQWVHNETGVPLATRNDGGPTSWQVAILAGDVDGDGKDDNFREFYLEFSDFQHAYEAGTFAGVDANGNVVPPDANTFRNSINPSFRKETSPILPDISRHPPICPGGVPRPCPEAISADDIGMLVVNYRNEPVGLRVFDPNRLGPDGKQGSQAAGLGGDLAFALQTRTDRAIPPLNTPLGNTPYPALNAALDPGDPFTPMLRTFAGDLVRVKIQAGAHEHEHNTTIHGLKWLQAGSGHGKAPNSGWRNAQNIGISEQFTLSVPILPTTAPDSLAQYVSLPTARESNLAPVESFATSAESLSAAEKSSPAAKLSVAEPKTLADVSSIPAMRDSGTARSGTAPSDFAYSVDSSQDGWWSGMWGILRSYNDTRGDLFRLPDNPVPLNVVSSHPLAGMCPDDGSAQRRVVKLTALLANDYLPKPAGVTIPANLNPVDNLGAPLNPNGGSLVYNSRPTVIPPVTVPLEEGGQLTLPGGAGPLHDPTAMMLVDTGNLQPSPQNLAEWFQCSVGGALDPACPVVLKPNTPLEPAVVRAKPGECLVGVVNNRLPPVAPDLGGFNTLLQMVNRDRNDVQGLTQFQNNLIRPSSHVGVHPQLVAYDVRVSDGANVGRNPERTVPPGQLRLFQWYAGDVGMNPLGPGLIELVHTPVEFGGGNLIPADKIKQGQKGLVGAVVIEPAGANWAADAGRNTAATVTAGGNDIREGVIVIQKGINMRYADGAPIPNIASEGLVITEDSHDAGQMAVNYGTEPLWFRFGLPPNVPFGRANGNGLGDIPNAHEAYSNNLAGVGGDPQTAVFTAQAGQEARLRVLLPTGVGRGTTFNVHGHGWQRDPYICPGSAQDGLPGKCTLNEVAARAIGDNPIGFRLGGQESVTPAAHFEMRLPKAGGAFEVDGDYLFRDQASFGNVSGIWGILRVQPNPMPVAAQ